MSKITGSSLLDDSGLFSSHFLLLASEMHYPRRTIRNRATFELLEFKYDNSSAPQAQMNLTLHKRKSDHLYNYACKSPAKGKEMDPLKKILNK